MIRLIDASDVAELVTNVGVEAFIHRLADRIEADFTRWPSFDKAPRSANHSAQGVIELMPASDDRYYSFKYVNGHPGNAARQLQTVVAFGVLASVETGYPILIADMTLLTALRTAAFSALAAKHLARPDARTMALIGLGAQAEFQALAFKRIVGIDRIQAYDLDPAAAAKFVGNMADQGITVSLAASAERAVLGADIITTITADKTQATILSDNMIGAGVHINAVGGDCPGKTELQKDILKRSAVFVELTEQTRVEGEIQQMPADFPVTELWQVISGQAPGRQSRDQITLLDSVGFAVEDYSALRLLHELAEDGGHGRMSALMAAPADPKNLFGLLRDAPSPVPAAA